MKAVFKFLFHPVLLGILGLLALALLIWFIGPMVAVAGVAPLESELARFVLIGLIVAAVVLRLVWRKLKARKKNEKLVEGLIEKDAAEKAAPQSDEVQVLRKRFEDALRVLKESQAAARASCGLSVGGPVAGMDHLSEWTDARMAVMASGSWIAAMTLMRPPQKGHLRASMAHTLMRRSSQLMRPGRLGAMGTRLSAQGVGTISARRVWCGANTPWNRRSAR